MTPFEEQFEILKSEIPNIRHERLTIGAELIVIPDVLLPDGWNLNSTEIRFIVPVGYPFAKPDCFWADPKLRLKSQATPQNTQMQIIPGFPDATQFLWFSYHANQWNPSRDNLSTFMHLIQTRLREVR